MARHAVPVTITRGDFDIFDPAAVDDPYPLFARLRDAAPVHRIPGTDFFLVSTWDMVQEAVARAEDFSSNLRAVLLAEPGSSHPGSLDMYLDGTVEQVLATADDPDHKVHRTLVMQTFTTRVRALQTECDRVADQLWNEHSVDGRIDWVDGMAERLPLAMLAHILGLRDEDLPYLLARAYDATELIGGIVDPSRTETLVNATLELANFLADRFAEAQADPQDDILGQLATSCASGDLDEGTCVNILIQLIAAGAESTAALLESAARMLAERPQLQQHVRQQPELLDPFIDEVLRLESPFRGHHRYVTADTSLGDVSLPAGSKLILLWGSANRDPRHFENADQLDLHRAQPRAHLAFGKGIHFCLGSHLARMEATSALRVLLDRSEKFDLDPGVPPQWIASLMVRRHRTLSLRYR